MGRPDVASRPFRSCPLSKPSSHPPLVRGNVSYFRLVKGESNEPLGIITANSKALTWHQWHLSQFVHSLVRVAARLLRSANEQASRSYKRADQAHCIAHA